MAPQTAPTRVQNGGPFLEGRVDEGVQNHHRRRETGGEDIDPPGQHAHSKDDGGGGDLEAPPRGHPSGGQGALPGPLHAAVEQDFLPLIEGVCAGCDEPGAEHGPEEAPCFESPRLPTTKPTAVVTRTSVVSRALTSSR